MCIKNNSVSANQCFQPIICIQIATISIEKIWRCFKLGRRVEGSFCALMVFVTFVLLNLVFVFALLIVYICVCAFLLFIVFMCMYVCVVALNRVCVRMFVLLFLILCVCLCFYVGAKNHFFWSLLKMSNQTQSLSAVPVC